MELIKFIDNTEDLINLISKGGVTISEKNAKEKVEKWTTTNYSVLLNIFKQDSKATKSVKYLANSMSNQRLLKKKWLKNLRIIVKKLKTQQIARRKFKQITKYPKQLLLSNSLLNKVKNLDKKIFVLGSEANCNWQARCWNACGILMRIILERTLDRKHPDIKAKDGLRDKINYSLSGAIFGKSVKESIKKLDNTTKITGDIVAHDSNILLSKNDVELAIVPLNILIKDVFNL
jgi:hypothetical protein